MKEIQGYLTLCFGRS